MRNALAAGALAMILCGPVWAQDEETVQLAEPWNAPYTGDDAKGDHVVGLWSFDEGAELADGSGGGHDLTLNGAKGVAGGRFGG